MSGTSPGRVHDKDQDFSLCHPPYLAEKEEIRLLYFEQRAKTYIEEVLVPALGISVFYYVMEFAWARRFRDQGAAGRGQIHFHLLGWLKSGEPHHIISVGNSRDSVVVTPLE